MATDRSKRTPGKIVILGKTGFIASALSQRLTLENRPFVSVGKAEADLLNPAAVATLRALLAPNDSLVVTSALTPEHGRSVATFIKNVKMIETLGEALKASAPAHVVYISSESVYSPACVDVQETSSCDTEDLYGLSHWVREKILSKLCRDYQIGLTILRPSAIYGAHAKHLSYGPNRFVDTALSEGRIELFSKGEETRDHVYIDDVTRVIEWFARKRISGVFNVASGRSISFAEVARNITASLGRPVDIRHLPAETAVTHRRVDIHALQATLTSFEATPFAIGIQTMIEQRSAPKGAV